MIIHYQIQLGLDLKIIESITKANFFIKVKNCFELYILISFEKEIKDNIIQSFT